MDIDPFQQILENPDALSFLKEEFQFPGPSSTELMDQIDLPTSSSSMLQDPMNLADYDLGFPFQQDAEDLTQFDTSNFFNESILDSDSLQTFSQDNISDLIPSFYDDEGEITIDTSSYITPDEIEKFEKAFPIDGIKLELQELMKNENSVFGASKSDDSDLEDGEIIDEHCPTPQLTKQVVIKCAEGSKEPMPLPEEWVQVWHKSGVPVYYHAPTRVVTWSRPYFLPKSKNARSHFTPIDSIPCMKEWMFGSRDGAKVLEEKCGLKKDPREHQTLSSDKVQVYLKNLWEFEENVVENYRKEANEGKRKPVTNPNILEIELPKGLGEASKHQNVWRVNLMNKTPVALLDEYAMHHLKVRAEYTFREVTDSVKPFICTVILKGVQYASEGGSSKKLAKQKASESTLKLVCPQVYQKFHEFINKKYSTFNKNLKELYEMSVDDDLAMAKLSQAGLPRPFQILKQCLQKRTPLQQKPEFEVKQLEDNNYFLRLVIGKFEASVECTNKREGKNIISQKILKQMYPSMSLGALVDLHSNIEHLKSKTDMPTPAQCKEMSRGLQDKPKTKILEILRTEMLKVSERLKEGKPISEKFAKLES